MHSTSKKFFVFNTGKNIYGYPGKPITFADIYAAKPEFIYTNGIYQAFSIISEFDRKITVKVSAPTLWQGNTLLKLFNRVRNLSKVIPTSRGGFRQVTDVDSSIYRLRYQLENGSISNLEYPIVITNTLFNWELTQKLQFFPFLSLPHLYKLYSLILDVRWFFYPEHKISKLERYFGYGVKKDDYNDKLYDRIDTLRSTWKEPNIAESIKACEKDIDISDPKLFLWRYWYSCLTKTHSEASADFKTSKKFLSILAYLWIDSVYAHCYDRLFEPTRILDDAAAKEYILWSKQKCS